MLYRLRRKSERQPLTHGQTQTPRTEIRSAIRFLAWLRDRDRTLATCTQADLDDWLTSAGPGRPELRSFIRWASEHQHLRRVSFPGTERAPRGHNTIENDDRWGIVHRLLHDDDTDPRIRIAGCLILLYGQSVSRIARMTTDQIISTPNGTQLQLGSRPVDLPEPLADLLRLLSDPGHHAAVLGRTGNARWLFPGRYADRPINPASLNHILKPLGAHSRTGRSTALMHLAAQLPAVVVARLLGLHINTATEWAQAAGNTRPGYAAEVARRTRPPTS